MRWQADILGLCVCFNLNLFHLPNVLRMEKSGRRERGGASVSYHVCCNINDVLFFFLRYQTQCGDVMKQNYWHHLKVNRFPIAAYPEVCCSFFKFIYLLGNLAISLFVKLFAPLSLDLML